MNKIWVEVNFQKNWGLITSPKFSENILPLTMLTGKTGLVNDVGLGDT